MLRPFLIIAASAVLFSGNVFANIIHFESDFDSAIDTGATIIDGSSVLAQRFGDTSLDSFGSLSGIALVFNIDGSNAEQMRLDLDTGYNNYQVAFDIETHNLFGSNHSFRMLADAPTVKSLDFGDCCNNDIDTFPFIGLRGPLVDDTPMHVEIDIDLILSMWTVSVSGVGSSSGLFANGGDVRSVRFSLAPSLGNLDPNPNVSVAIDNLVVSSVAVAVPTPASLWLCISALLALGFGRRGKRS